MDFYIELNDNRNIELLHLLLAHGLRAFSLADFPSEILPANSSIADTSDSAFVFSPARKFAAGEIEHFPNNITLYAGNLGQDAEKLLWSKNIRYINFMDDEDFVEKNADLTAEGVLSILIQKTSLSIFKLKILVLGNGRCAKSIATLFNMLNLDYSIAARNNRPNNARNNRSNLRDFIDIESELKERLGEFDVIINTIPAKILGKAELALISNDTVFIEIASKPCLDATSAHFTYLPSPALPQIYSPKSAANLLFKLIKI